jgi:hypothetical protein
MKAAAMMRIENDRIFIRFFEYIDGDKWPVSRQRPHDVYP